jgi:hypothetical protein
MVEAGMELVEAGMEMEAAETGRSAAAEMGRSAAAGLEPLVVAVMEMAP